MIDLSTLEITLPGETEILGHYHLEKYLAGIGDVLRGVVIKQLRLVQPPVQALQSLLKTRKKRYFGVVVVECFPFLQSLIMRATPSGWVLAKQVRLCEMHIIFRLAAWTNFLLCSNNSWY